MSDKNLWWKLLVVAGLAVVAYLEAFPLNEKLKGGIDLVGGTSLLYEIDDTGVDAYEKQTLAEQVMRVLRRRVDPDGVRNLVWRPIGSNRLEIQMPRTAGKSTALRETYRQAQQAIKDTNLAPREVEQALRAEDRGAALTKGVTAREALITDLASTYDALQAAGDDVQARTNAEVKYEAALDALLATNIDVAELDTIAGLAAGQIKRGEQLAKLKAKYSARANLIDVAVEAYEKWSKERSGLDDPADLQRLLRGAGVLEFRLLAEPNVQNPKQFDIYREQLAERGPRVGSGDEYGWFELEKPASFLHLTGQRVSILEDPEQFDEFKKTMTNAAVDEFAGKYYVLANLSANKGLLASSKRKWSLKTAIPRPDPQSGGYVVMFSLDERGGAQFEALTRESQGKRLCIMLDGKAISAPTIQSTIRTEGIISGDFSAQEVNELAQTLNAGALPARLKQTPIAIKNIGPSLGQTNREHGLNAAKLGTLLVLIFMAVYYLKTGLIANIAVVLNLLFVVGIMATMDATFTLPGIAGLALTVGMAVDANVLINERIREELKRSVSLRLAIKTGYDKAFSAIVDSNVTTIITCVILGYFGSEEVKGFALTLGLGLVCNVLTAVFVTRWLVLGLVDLGVIKSLPMLQLIRVPNINWMGMRRGFQTVSVILVVCGLALFWSRGSDKYDIEFLGGVSVQIEAKPDAAMSDVEVREHVTVDAANWLTDTGEALAGATVKADPSGQAGVFTIESAKLTATQIESYVLEVMEANIVKDGIEEIGANAIRITTVEREIKQAGDADTPEAETETVKLEPMTLDEARVAVNETAAEYARSAGRKISAASVQLVQEVGGAATGETFEVITTETNKKVVRDAIVAVMADQLNIQGPVNFDVRKDSALATDGLFPIEVRRLASVINAPDAVGDLRDYVGGVAIVLDRLLPAQTEAQIAQRLRDMRLQPDFEQSEWRDFEVFGLTQAGTLGEKPTYSSVAVAVVDHNFPFDQDEILWRQNLAAPELALTQAALRTERSLQKVTQFGSQVAGKAKNQALLAMVLALIAIVIYIWLRFGSLHHGLAAIAALVHDVSIALGAVAAGYYVATSPIGAALGITDFKIDLAMVAAFLTLVGYSLNDTIVVFDRIRENRGKIATVSSTLVNTSINQMLGRTLLTSITTLCVVLILYALGGRGIHGISFAILIGVIVGTYSSIGVACPLLLASSRSNGPKR